MELDPAQFADRLVSGMSDAIIYADAEGVIRLWNRGATRAYVNTQLDNGAALALYASCGFELLTSGLTVLEQSW